MNRETEIDLDNPDLFSDDLDFDNLNMESGAIADDRSPMTRVRDTFWGGVVTHVADERNIEDHIRKALPNEFSVVYDDVNKHYDQLDKARRNLLQPIQKELPNFKRDLNKLTPIVKRLVGDRFGNKFDELTATRERAGEGDPDQQEISSAMTDVFSAWRETQLTDRQQDLSDKFITDQTEEQRFKSMYTLLTKISNNIATQTNYEQQVGLKLAEKQLELSYKKYHILRNLLRVTTDSTNATLTELKAITKNTALPDIIKRRNSENFQQLFLDEWQGRTAGSIVDFGKNFISNWWGNIQKRASETGEQIADGMRTVADAAATFREMDDMQNEMGGERKSGADAIKDMAIGGLGGGLTNKLLNAISKKVLAYIEDDPSNIANVNYARYIHKNQAQLLKSIVHELAEKSGIIGKIATFAEDTMPDISRDREKVQHTLASNATMEAQWDRISHTTLNKIIPGWLSKIHYRLSQMVEGKSLAQQEVYDVLSERFTTQDEHLKNLQEHLWSSDERKDTNETIERFITNLFSREDRYKKEDLSPAQMELLRQVVLDKAINELGFDVKSFGSLDTYKNQKNKDVSEEEIKQLRDMMADILSTGDGTHNKYRRSEFSDRGSEAHKLYTLANNLDTIRQYNEEMQKRINLLHQAGDNEDLVSLGLAKRNSKKRIEIDHAKLRDFRRSLPEINVDESIPKLGTGTPFLGLPPYLHGNRGFFGGNVLPFPEQDNQGGDKTLTDVVNSLNHIRDELLSKLDTAKSEPQKIQIDGLLTKVEDSLIRIEANQESALQAGTDILKAIIDGFKAIDVASITHNVDLIADSVLDISDTTYRSRQDNKARSSEIRRSIDLSEESILALAESIRNGDKAAQRSGRGQDNIPYTTQVLDHLNRANISLIDIGGILTETLQSIQANHAEIMGNNSVSRFFGRMSLRISEVFAAPLNAINRSVAAVRDFVGRQKDKVSGFIGRRVASVRNFGHGIMNEVRAQLARPDDIYVIGGERPLIYGRDLEKGVFFNRSPEGRVERKPIRNIHDIKGEVVRLPENQIVVTLGDFTTGLETRNPTFAQKAGGFLVKAIVSPFKLASWIGNKVVSGASWIKGKATKIGGKITDWLNRAEDVYNSKREVLLAKVDIEKGKYYVVRNGNKEVIRTLKDIGSGPVFRFEDDSVVLSTEQIREGIFNIRGELIKVKSIAGVVGRKALSAASLAWKVVKAPIDIMSKGLASLRKMFESKLVSSLLIHVPDNVVFQANTVHLYANKIRKGADGKEFFDNALFGKADKRKAKREENRKAKEEAKKKTAKPDTDDYGTHEIMKGASGMSQADLLKLEAADRIERERERLLLWRKEHPEVDENISKITDLITFKNKFKLKGLSKDAFNSWLKDKLRIGGSKSKDESIPDFIQKPKGIFSSFEAKNEADKAQKSVMGKWSAMLDLVKKKDDIEDAKQTKGLATNLVEQMQSLIKLEAIKSKPKKVRGDSDGDGIRDGSWMEQKKEQFAQWKAQRAADKQRRHEDKESKKREAKEGGILSNILDAIKGVVSGIGLAAAAAGAIALATGAAGSMSDLVQSGMGATDYLKAGVVGYGLWKTRGITKFLGKTAFNKVVRPLATSAGRNLVSKPLMGAAAKYAAKRAAGAGAIAAAGGIIGPLGVAIAGIALTAWTVIDVGMAAWKWWDRRRDIRRIEYLRMLGYGYYTGQEGDFEKRKIALRYFESEMFSKMGKTNNGYIGIVMDFNDVWENYAGDFDMNVGDEGAKAEFRVWFETRFKPVFYRWITMCSVMTRRTGTDHTLSNLDDTLARDQYAYFCREVNNFSELDYDPLNVRNSCFPSLTYVQAMRVQIDDFIKKHLVVPKDKVMQDGKVEKVNNNDPLVKQGIETNVKPKPNERTDSFTKMVSYYTSMSGSNAINRMKDFDRAEKAKVGFVDPRELAMSEIVRGDMTEELLGLIDVYRNNKNMIKTDLINHLISEMDERFDLGDLAKVRSDLTVWINKAFLPAAKFVTELTSTDDSGALLPYTQAEAKRLRRALSKELDDTDADDIEFDLTNGRFREIGFFGRVDDRINKKVKSTKPIDRYNKPQDPQTISNALPKPITLPEPNKVNSVAPMTNMVPANDPTMVKERSKLPTYNRVPVYDTRKPSVLQDYGKVLSDLLTTDNKTDEFFTKFWNNLLAVDPHKLGYNSAYGAFVRCFEPALGKSLWDFCELDIMLLLGNVIFPSIEFLDQRVGRLGSGFNQVPDSVYKNVVNELKQIAPFSEYRFSMSSGYFVYVTDDVKSLKGMPNYDYHEDSASHMGDKVVLPKPEPKAKVKLNNPTTTHNKVKPTAKTDSMVSVPPLKSNVVRLSEFESVGVEESLKKRDYTATICKLFANVSSRDFYDYVSHVSLLNTHQRTEMVMVGVFRENMPYFKENPQAFKEQFSAITTLAMDYLNPILLYLDNTVGRVGVYYKPQTEGEYVTTKNELVKQFADKCAEIVLTKDHQITLDGKRPVTRSELDNLKADKLPDIRTPLDATKRTALAQAISESPARGVVVKDKFKTLEDYTPSANADLDYDPDNAYAKAIAGAIGNFGAESTILVKLVRDLFGVSHDNLNIDTALKFFVQHFGAGQKDLSWYLPWEETLMVWLREQLLPAISFVVGSIGRKEDGYEKLNRISGDSLDELRERLVSLFGEATRYHVTYKRKAMLFTNVETHAETGSGVKTPITVAEVKTNKPLNYDFILNQPNPIDTANAKRWDNIVKPGGKWSGNKPTAFLKPNGELGGVAIGSTHRGLSQDEIANAKANGHKITDDIEKKIARFDNAIALNSRKAGIDAHLIRSVIRQESQGNPNAKSYADARGLMQIVPSSAGADLGIAPNDLWNPDINIRGGVEYLRRQLEYYDGSIELALAAYNAGAGNVNKAIKIAGTRDPEAVLNALPQVTGKTNSQQTQQYVVKITNDYRKRLGLDGKSVYSKQNNRVALYTALDPEHVDRVKLDTATANNGMGDFLAPLTQEATNAGRKAFQAAGSGKGQRNSYYNGVKVTADDVLPAVRVDTKVTDEPEAVRKAMAWDTSKDSKSYTGAEWTGNAPKKSEVVTTQKTSNDFDMFGEDGSFNLRNVVDRKRDEFKDKVVNIITKPTAKQPTVDDKLDGFISKETKVRAQASARSKAVVDAKANAEDVTIKRAELIQQKQLVELTRIRKAIEKVAAIDTKVTEKEVASVKVEPAEPKAQKIIPPTDTTGKSKEPRRFTRRVEVGNPTVKLDRQIA